VFGPGWDIRLDFEVSVPLDQSGAPRLTTDNWAVRSDDPVQWSNKLIIPEPATLSLLGCALIGLAGFRRRKN
jgi:hypothetical protein